MIAFGFAEDTSVQKTANKFAFSLTKSYLCNRKCLNPFYHENIMFQSSGCRHNDGSHLRHAVR